MSTSTTIILSEGRNTPPVRRSLERELLDGLAQRQDLDVLVVPHLYDLEPEGPVMGRLQAVGGDLIVLAWLYPRAVYWVLDANEIKGTMGRTSFFSEAERDTGSTAGEIEDENAAERTIWCVDLRSSNEAAVILGEVDRIVAGETGEPVASSGRAKGAESAGPTRIEEAARRRWYPVIDSSRCQNCLECLNFCLFGVFGVDESGQLFLEQPDACRDGCPACARVCPSEAIMFPSHSNPGIAGDPAVSPSQSAMNLVQLFGAPSPTDLAAAERDQALQEAATAGRASEKDPANETEADRPSEKDEFDDLVDKLDEMDL